MSTIQYPESADLRSLLRFAPEDGHIWLGEHRMLLLHAGAMSELRKELITSVGQQQARRILTRRAGAQGARDERTVGRLRRRASTPHARRLRQSAADSPRIQLRRPCL